MPSVNRKPAASSKSAPGVRIVTARDVVSRCPCAPLSTRISIGSSPARRSLSRWGRFPRTFHTEASVWKVRGNRPHLERDRLAGEEPMEIRVESGAQGHRETTSLAVTMRTPGADFELAAGFLFTEGIVARKRDLLRIEYCTDPGVVQE